MAQGNLSGAVDPTERAVQLVREARRVLVLSGAGLSTESGIPDFRGDSGVWTRFRPDDFRYERFLHDPAGFWRLRAQLMEALDLDRARPHAAHESLARAAASPRVLGHVTQNIDGLLQTAGHPEDKLVEIHGSARSVRCIGCGSFFPYEVARAAVEAGRFPPPCPACHQPLKPGTVLFGETLPEDRLMRAAEWAREADLVLVVGSSLVVYPVASLPGVALDRGARLVIANEAPTPYDGHADAVLRGRAGVVVPELLRSGGLA